MKTTVADWKTRIYCVRLRSLDGRELRFTPHPTDLKMSNGEIYRSGSGYEFSGISSTTTFSPASVDFTGYVSSAIGFLDREEVASGVWNNGRAYLFATSWTAPVEDEEPIYSFILGKAQFTDQRYSIEFMGLVDALSQSTGRSYSPTCQWTFLDRHLGAAEQLPYHASRCTGPRAAPDGPSYAGLLVTGTVAAFSGRANFSDPARTEAADYFGEGAVRFITGANAGLAPIKIKTHSAGGDFVLHENCFFAVAIGDQYEMIPGCRKRFREDCVNKWGNGINSSAKPHIPNPTQYQEMGRG